MVSKSYEELLERALSQLPQEIQRQARFELPEPASSEMGNRTIFYNIKEIADVVRRPYVHSMCPTRPCSREEDVHQIHVDLQERYP